MSAKGLGRHYVNSTTISPLQNSQYVDDDEVKEDTPDIEMRGAILDSSKSNSSSLAHREKGDSDREDEADDDLGMEQDPVGDITSTIKKWKLEL